MSTRRISGAASRLGPVALIGMTAVIPMGLAGCPCSCTQATPPGPTTSTSSPLAIVIEDFNSDGVADLAVASGRSSSAEPNVRGVVSTILQNRSSPGTFGSGIETSVSAVPRRLATGDIDNSAGVDLLLTGSGSTQNNVEALLQTSTGAQPLVPTTTVTADVGVGLDAAIADLNGDGAADIVVADDAGGGRLIVLVQASATGGFLPATNLAIDARPTGFDLGDLDRDGRTDLVAAGTTTGGTSRLSIYFQAATSTLQFQPRVDVPMIFLSGMIRIADLNSDGQLDVVAIDESAEGLALMLGNSTAPGSFAAPMFIATGMHPRTFAIADLNADGRPDLATANRDGRTVSVLLQDSSTAGAFSAPVNYPVTDPPNDIAIGNLNGDALPDIALAAGDRSTVLMNVPTAPGTFAPSMQVGR